ncbi:hypothetical protein J1614_010552 [Plenodomus biglobosus]|nr:hypothetical protein J1614_010552 [Plenodomus biglobosus]
MPSGGDGGSKQFPQTGDIRQHSSMRLGRECIQGAWYAHCSAESAILEAWRCIEAGATVEVWGRRQIMRLMLGPSVPYLPVAPKVPYQFTQGAGLS